MNDPNMAMPEKGPIESKVTVASFMALMSGIVIAVLNAVVADNSLLASWHPVLQFLLITAAPTVITFFGAFQAPHTPRADKQALKS